MKVLIIDDDAIQLKVIKGALEREGFSIDQASSGEEGLYKAEINNYRVIILDLGLPDLDGLEISRQLRQQGSNSFILMLTAKNDEQEKIIGFLAGADDYVTKPYSLGELIMRVKVGLRRVENTIYPKEQKLSYRGLSLDPVRHLAWHNGSPLKLPPKEFAILECFLRNAGRPLSHQELYESVWGEDEEEATFGQAIKVHICLLRRKLNGKNKENDYITTIPGIGYKL